MPGSKPIRITIDADARAALARHLSKPAVKRLTASAMSKSLKACGVLTRHDAIRKYRQRLWQQFACLVDRVTEEPKS